jgi:hypothetical protein
MDRELTIIQITQDMNELAEQYEGAASNERLWAKGAPDTESAQMHEENAEHCSMMAEMYHRMAKYPEAILKLFEED